MPRISYTTEQIEFLRERRLIPLAQLTEEFNTRFETLKTRSAIHSFFGNHGIQRVRPRLGRGNGKPRLFTPEQAQWLRDNYVSRSVVALTAAFNSRFGDVKTWQQIKSFVHNRGITSGRTGRFEPGQTSWNKGVTGYMGANKTSFKKGNLPRNHRPLWSERVCSKDGYIYISVPERNPYTGFPTRFRQKHVWLWEQANGPVPKRHCVIFLDSDKLNFAPENLACIPRNVLLSLNMHNYAAAPAELKPSILALAKLEAEAGIRSVRRGAGRKRKAA